MNHARGGPKIRPKHQNAVLIATLGTEPQVITAAWDLLMERGEPLRDIWILHTSPQHPAIGEALQRLHAEAWALPDGSAARMRCVEVLDPDDLPVQDVVTPRAVDGFFRTLYAEVARAKRDGRRIHLLIAGGRKTMAVFGMAVAQLLFEDNDALWHLFSEGDFLRSKRMHPRSGDRVSLVPIPVIRWSPIPASLLGFADMDDPFDALARVESLRVKERLQQAEDFLENVLTPAQRAVVDLAIGEGLTNARVAERLHLSRKTVGHHLSSAYDRARAYLGLQEMDRRRMAAWLLVFYEYRKGQGK